MRLRGMLLVFLLGLLVTISTTGLGQQKFVDVFPKVANPKYGGTVLALTTWGRLNFNLNPFFPSGVSLGLQYLMYGYLFFIHPYNGNVSQFFGVDYEWKDGNKTLIITIREGLKWSDGRPFTANDVAFTFNLMKKHPELDSAALWASDSGLESVTAISPTQVQFKFSRPNTPLFMYIAMTPIVPEHVWSKIPDPVKFINEDPVVAGPFIYEKGSFDPQNNTITLVKNPNFFMAPERPFVDKITIKALTGTQPITEMIAGRGDWAFVGSGINPEELWVKKNPATNKYWWPVSAYNVLYVNTLKAPFNDVFFRKALSIAINRKALQDRAYFGIGGYDVSATLIIPAQRSLWYDTSLKSTDNYLTQYNPKEAERILTAAGYKKDARGNLLGKDGKPLPTFKILVGAGWGDFITLAQIISENLKALGISTVIDQQPWDSYISSVMSATYDMVICWTVGNGPNPYYMYYQMFHPAFSASKIGEVAKSNYSRFTDPKITEALEKFSSTSDLNEQKKALSAIQKVLLDKLPVIPLTTRTDFLEYSEARFIGWPSASNPYAGAGTVDWPSAPIIMLNVRLK